MRSSGWILAAALALASGGCKERELSGQDLQGLKRETLQKEQTKLTTEQKIQISSIQARTVSDFEKKVRQILEARKKKNAPPAKKVEETKKA